MDWSWLAITLATVGRLIVTTIAIYIGVVALTRVAGLRSFSKMSSFDFAITIAIGSIIASTVVLESVPPTKGLVALALLYGIQIGTAALRKRADAVATAMDNDPILLMAGQRVLHENLRKTHVTEGDLRGKLREANVLDLKQVRAVVMEATGDVSVLHAGEDDDATLDEWLFKGVIDAHLLFEDGE